MADQKRPDPKAGKKSQQTSGHKSKLGPWAHRPTGYMRPFGGRRGR